MHILSQLKNHNLMILEQTWENMDPLSSTIESIPSWGLQGPSSSSVGGSLRRRKERCIKSGIKNSSKLSCSQKSNVYQGLEENNCLGSEFSQRFNDGGELIWDFSLLSQVLCNPYVSVIKSIPKILRPNVVQSYKDILVDINKTLGPLIPMYSCSFFLELFK